MLPVLYYHKLGLTLSRKCSLFGFEGTQVVGSKEDEGREGIPDPCSAYENEEPNCFAICMCLSLALLASRSSELWYVESSLAL